jgi:phosphate acetyltransferase
MAALTHQRFAEEVPGMLTAPMNRTTRRIFVAATRMNDGKTTVSLGLFGALRSTGINVGYIKPVAQRIVEMNGEQVDEDTRLLDAIYDVKIPVAAMSPVAIDANFTRRYLDSPEEMRPQVTDKICRAFDRAAFGRDMVIIEGSGHAGVGSVFDCSNASNASMLGSKVILVAAGGIGKPVDELAMNHALFEKMGVECLGVILNKVLPDKMDFIREYGARGLARIGLPLLGVLPLRPGLAQANLTQIVEEIDGHWMHKPEPLLSERINKVIIGAMSDRSIVDYLRPGTLVIAPGDREDLLFAIVAASGIAGYPTVSGIILTNNQRPHPRILEMLRHTAIPVIGTDAESFAVTTKINHMIVKTQPEDRDKITVIENLIRENIDLPGLMAKV